MRQFQFALETLLRIRRHAEERVRQEFADQLRRVGLQEEKIKSMLESRQQAEEQARLGQSGPEVDVVMEQTCDEYNQCLAANLRQARAELTQLQAECTRQRDILLQAQREVKILEKLKERRFAEYLKTARREEQLFLDEVSITQYQATRQV